VKKVIFGLVLLLMVSALHAGKGKIRVASDHQGAYVYVDGKKKAMIGEGFTSILLEEGEYTIQVKKKSIDGEWLYTDTKKVFVGEDTSSKISFNLVKLNVSEIIQFIIYEVTCSSDNASSCTATGYLYENGQGVQKDRRKAIKFYMMGCNGGDSDGCTKLGYIYRTGEETKEDKKQAMKFFKKGCDSGNADGCTNVGMIYYSGYGLKEDKKQAMKFYKLGCDGGNANGCVNLGYMYDKGYGVKTNLKKAIELYKKGCDGGNEQGCSNYKILNKNTSSTKCTNYTVITVNQLNIRNKPKKPSTIVGKVNRGDTVCIYRFVGKWGKSDKGWISGKYLK